MWIDLATRSDASGFAKVCWAILALIPLVPVHLRADQRRPVVT